MKRVVQYLEKTEDHAKDAYVILELADADMLEADGIVRRVPVEEYAAVRAARKGTDPNTERATLIAEGTLPDYTEG